MLFFYTHDSLGKMAKVLKCLGKMAFLAKVLGSLGKWHFWPRTWEVWEKWLFGQGLEKFGENGFFCQGLGKFGNHMIKVNIIICGRGIEKNKREKILFKKPNQKWETK